MVSRSARGGNASPLGLLRQTPLISGVNTIATKEEMIEDCAQPALSTDGPEWACTGVIASDGWEITSNYKKRL